MAARKHVAFGAAGISRLYQAAIALLVLLGAASGPTAWAAETNVAVAANFTEPARAIARAFEAKTGDHVALSFGATRQFYTQIRQDAPFTVFLAADEDTPKKIVEEGLAVAGSRFTYAVGRLVLWGNSAGFVPGEAALRGGAFERLAVANPKTATYGAAAVRVLTRLGVYDTLAPKLVQGNNIAQTFQFVETGNAELGFVALSQVITWGGAQYWMVPTTLHEPIRQDAVLLTKGADDAVARAFLDFLKSAEALGVIERYGYGIATAP